MSKESADTAQALFEKMRPWREKVERDLEELARMACRTFVREEMTREVRGVLREALRESIDVTIQARVISEEPPA